MSAEELYIYVDGLHTTTYYSAILQHKSNLQKDVIADNKKGLKGEKL